MSLFSVLNIGTRGLAASQLAMDVTSQNISNADVEGYSRKRLTQAAEYRYDAQFGQMGMGVDIISIDRIRDTFIDEQIRRQNQEVGMNTELDNTLRSIESIFIEPSDTGLQKFIDQFFDSWNNLANNPTDASARTMVRTNADILTDVFHNIGSELMDLRQTRNGEISQRIEKINELSEKIFNLNIEIGNIEISTSKKANDSRDKRDTLLKQIAEITDINVIENARGQVTITSDGHILVSPINFLKLETSTTTIMMPDGSQTTDIGLRFADSKINYKPASGQLKGLFESRDQIVPEYQKLLDKLAVQLVEKVNYLHSTGYTLNGYTGMEFFDAATTGASNIQLAASINSDVNNIAAARGGEAQPAAVNTLLAGTHNFGVAPLQLYRDPAAVPPVAARNIVDGSVVVTNGVTTLQRNVDYHIEPITGRIQMLHAGFDASNLTVNFQHRTSGFNGPGDNSNAIAIGKLREALTMNPDSLGNGTATFTEFYSSVIGKVGLNKNSVTSTLETRTFLVQQYEAHQDSIAGVSLDEEMANMVRYQHTYQAAAHLITIADKMLDVLMTM